MEVSIERELTECENALNGLIITASITHLNTHSVCFLPDEIFGVRKPKV